jgi:hypothetical protein
MASSAGRLARVLAGIALILVGVLAIGGTAGWVVAAIGLVPLAAGALDVCVFAPLAGYPFNGNALRQACAR